MRILVAYTMLILGLGINYIFNISIARILGPANFGDYSYALYLFNIFSMIAISSLDMAALRFIPQQNDSRQIRIAIQLLSVLLGIIFSLLFIITIYFFVDGERATLAYLFVPSVIPFVLLTVNVAILQANHIVGPRMAFRYIIEPLTKIVMLFILCAFFSKNIAPGVSFFVALIAANIAAMSIYWNRLSCFEFGSLKHQLPILMKFMGPMFVSGTISVLSGRLDLLILGGVVASSDLGFYSSAFQTAGMLSIVLQGIETVYTPIFSSHIGIMDMKALNQDYQRSLRWTMLISSPLLLVFILYPELIMLPFGKNYLNASSILAILCFGQFFLLSLGAANSILVLLGKTKIVLFISIIFIFLSAVFVTVGAKTMGTIGAAIGVAVVMAVTNTIRMYFVYNLTKCNPFSFHYFKIVASLLITLIIGFITKSFLGNSGFIIFPILLLIINLSLGLHEEEKIKLYDIYLKLGINIPYINKLLKI